MFDRADEPQSAQSIDSRCSEFHDSIDYAKIALSVPTHLGSKQDQPMASSITSPASTRQRLPESSTFNFSGYLADVIQGSYDGK